MGIGFREQGEGSWNGGVNTGDRDIDLAFGIQLQACRETESVGARGFVGICLGGGVKGKVHPLETVEQSTLGKA